MRRRPATIAIGIALSLGLAPTAVAAQDDIASASPAPGPTSSVELPSIDGLAWYRSIDLSGPEFAATLPEDQVADWATLAENADATLDELTYTYQAAFDPTDLPDLGGVATVTIAGADEAAVRDAVVADIVGQVTDLGAEAPVPEAMTLGAKTVTHVPIPDDIGFEDATIYVHGDTAWVFLMDQDRAAEALQQLP